MHRHFKVKPKSYVNSWGLEYLGDSDLYKANSLGSHGTSDMLGIWGQRVYLDGS